MNAAERNEAEIFKMMAETRKLMMEAMKLQEESFKIEAERKKIERERWWYPVMVAASIIGATLAFAKLVLG